MILDDATVRGAALKKKAAADEWKALFAGWLLDAGVTPGDMRDGAEMPYVADVMDDVLHQEAKVRHALSLI